ncbi:type II toxin-antitoxin system VapC family toxin [Aeromicrobium sp.]|uniref:type II toxin-antitoxin system VapC family toxin n=1 Tax=Aeromicrobium sp. TaxID=1871063 RepID=UPI003D6BF792
MSSASPDAREEVVVDASVVVDLLADTNLGEAAHAALVDKRLIAPAHIDAEVLSALGRMQRSGLLTEDQATNAVRGCIAVPMDRRSLPELLAGAWSLRSKFSLRDALYVELAEDTGCRLITSDAKLGRQYEQADVLRVSS